MKIIYTGCKFYLIYSEMVGNCEVSVRWTVSQYRLYLLNQQCNIAFYYSKMEEKKDNDGNRLDTIMKVDTMALLSTIRDIESKLSEYQRPDIVPSWAEALMKRIDDLEKRAVPSSSAGSFKDPNSGLPVGGGGGISISMADLAVEERLMHKLKENVDSHMNSTRVSLESKLSSTTLELDRVHKLLQIRPTTSELQQVVLMIHDMSRRVQDGVREVSGNIRGLVQDKVAEEMQMIMAQLTSNQGLQEESVGIIAKKVDGYTEDISNIRKGMESACQAMDAKIMQSQKEVISCTENVAKLRELQEANNNSTRVGIANLVKSHDMANAVFSEYRNTVSENLMEVKSKMDAQDGDVKLMLAGASAQMLSISETVNACKANIDDFRFTYEVDCKVQQAANIAIQQQLSVIDEKQAKLISYCATLEDADVVKVLGLQTEQINRSKSMIEDLDAQIATISSKTAKATKAVGRIEDEVQKIPDLITAQAQRIDELLVKNDKTNLMILSMQSVLEKTEKKLLELNDLQERMQDSKADADELKERLQKNQSTIVALLESSDENERKIEQLQELIDGQEEQIQAKLQEMKGGLLTVITKKQAEVEAVVANLRENVDIMAQGMGDMSSDGGAIVAGGSIQGAGGGRTGGGGPSGFTGGFGSFSRAGHSSKPGTPGAPSTPGVMAAMGGGALTQKEQNEVSLGNAEFIADLCISFEEIAVRKSYVGELPPTMCEHITGTAQSLTAFIATCCDSEAIQKVLRAGPKEAIYDDQLVTNLRQQKLDEFFTNINSIISANNSAPGLVRTDARNLFMKQLRTALTMCMSKHDQVLVVSHSRFGAIKIPTCIACDRPLLDKVRRDNVIQPDDVSQRRNFPAFGGASQLEDAMGSMQSSLSLGGVSGTSPPRLKVRGKGTGAIRLPAPRGETKILRPNSQGEANMVMRGGLKMPLLDRAVLAVSGSEDRGDDMFPEMNTSMR